MNFIIFIIKVIILVREEYKVEKLKNLRRDEMWIGRKENKIVEMEIKLKRIWGRIDIKEYFLRDM